MEGTEVIFINLRVYTLVDVYLLWFHQDVIDPARGFMKDDSIILVSCIKVVRWVNGAMILMLSSVSVTF